MTAEVKCPACGKTNQPDKLFCKFCGAKLDLSKARFDGGTKAVLGRVIGRVVRLCVTLGLLVVLVLLLWPKAPGGAVGDAEDAERAHNQLAALHRAVQQNLPLTHTFSEAEANAYLAHLMSSADPDEVTTAHGFQIQAVNLTFTADTVWVHIEAGWQIVTLTYAIELVPITDEAGLRVDVKHVVLGHLAVPGVLQERFAGRVWPVFEQMERERWVLDHMTRIALSEGELRLEHSP